MKHLKTYKIFESLFLSDLSGESKRKEYDKDIIKQFILDLTDIGFSIDLYDPNFKNMMRPNLNIIYCPGEKAESFKLGDVKETISLISNYMKSEEYFIDDIVVHGPDFRIFRKIDISKDTNEWDDNQELVQMIIYFDCDLLSTRTYEHLKKYNLFESVNMADQIADSLLFNSETTMAFNFNREIITDVESTKDLIEKYNDFYISEGSWFGGPQPRKFVEYFNEKYSTKKNAGPSSWYPTIDLIINLKNYGEIRFGFSLIDKKYKSVSLDTIKLPPNAGEFETEVFNELKRLSRKWRFGELDIEEMMDYLYLDVVNYFTWEWEDKIVETIEVSRDYGYQSIFSDDFLQTIKEFCFEFTDKDYNVDILECIYYRKFGEKLKSISIDINNNKNVIDNEIFKSVLLNIKDFCENEELKIDIEMISSICEDYTDVDDFILNKNDENEYEDLSIIVYQPLPQQ